MPEATLSGTTLHYETQGEGSDWVTLINGHMRSADDFRMFARYLVERGFAVLRYDHRGCGRSLRGLEGDLPWDTLVTDLVQLWDHLGIRRSHVVGISMGGVVAQHLAMDYADRLGKLVLVSTANRLAWLKSSAEPWPEDVAQINQRLRTFFNETFVEGHMPLIQAMAKQMGKQLADPTFHQGSLIQRQLLELMLERSFGESQVPTMMVHGADDQVILVGGVGDMQAHFPDHRIELLEGVGHLLLAEAPKKLYGLAAEFFA